ncbi:ATP-binding cassette domain-containing protein, partial [Neptunomonas phycophila]
MDGASFDVRRGEIQAVFGANGAGKSARIKALSGA